MAENSADKKIMKILEYVGALSQYELCVQMWEVAQGSLSADTYSRVFWQNNDWSYFEMADGSLAVMGHIKGAKGDVLFTFAAPDAPGSEYDNYGVMALVKENLTAGRLKILTWDESAWVSDNRLFCTVGGLFTVFLQLEQGGYVVYVMVDDLYIKPFRKVAPGGPFTSVLHAKVGAQRWLNDVLGGLFND